MQPPPQCVKESKYHSEAAVGNGGGLRIRTFRLPVGAKRRGKLMKNVPNSPKLIEISEQFCEIATGASTLAMTGLVLF